MKLVDQIETTLTEKFERAIVLDQRGDGHFVEIICIDVQFDSLNMLAKSRLIFSVLKPFESKVHAWSVKGFTPEEWAEQEDDFAPQIYKHYQS